MNGPSPHPTVRPPEDRQWLWLLGDCLTLLVGSRDTGGAFCLAEITSPAGGGPPPHIHEHEDELFFVLEGEFEFLCGGRTSRRIAGSALYLPKQLCHGFKNVGPGAGRLLMVAAPGGLEQFIRAVGVPAPAPAAPSPVRPADIERLFALAPRFGIELCPEVTRRPPEPAEARPETSCSVMGLGVQLKLGSEDTAGQFTLTELTCPCEAGVPLHRHDSIDEVVYVQAGGFDFVLGDRVERVTPGSTALIPRGTLHRFESVGPAPGRLMEIHTPAPVEPLFATTGESRVTS